MQPYVIKQGDYLAALAYQFGFDADTVWNDPKNAQLQGLRPNPNILLAGDVLYIPDQVDKPPASQSLTPGSTNTFVTSAPTTTLTQKFVGPDSLPYASRPYVVQELPELTGLATDSGGGATFQVPVTLATATLVFSDTGEAWTLQIGSLDPIDTLSGIFARLQNLGYVSQAATFDANNASNNLATMRAGLQHLKADQAPSAAPPASVPPAAPTPLPSEPAPASASSPPPPSLPASGPDASGGTDAPPASGTGPDLPDMPFTSSGGDAASGVQGADGQEASSADDANAPPSDATFGLADGGTLDADTSALLVQLHGC